MSLPPNTGAVELASYRAHVRQLLAKGERLDSRSFDAIRLPIMTLEVQGSDGRGGGTSSSCIDSTTASPAARQSSTLRSASHLATVMYTDNYGACLQGIVDGLLGPPRPHRPAAGRLNISVEAPFWDRVGSSGSAKSNVVRAGNTITSNGDADLPLRQLEGYLLSMLEGCVDLSQLCIYEGEACWVLNLTISLFSVDGSLWSSCLHACLVALRDLKLPKTRLPNGDVIESRQLRLSCLPVCCSFGVIAGETLQLLHDPTAIEEQVVDGLVVVAVTENGELAGHHYVGRCALPSSALGAVAELWLERSSVLRKTLFAGS